LKLNKILLQEFVITDSGFVGNEDLVCMFEERSDLGVVENTHVGGAVIIRGEQELRELSIVVFGWEVRLGNGRIDEDHRFA
jgi:hypothetical protein